MNENSNKNSIVNSAGAGTAIGDGSYEDSGSTGSDTFLFRLKRDIPTITNPNNQVLNELAKRVLVAMDSAFIANEDSGECLRRTLCQTNKWSRLQEGKHKIMIPVFRFDILFVAI